MAITSVRIPSRPRTVFGKRVRLLRHAGWTPANVYGPGVASLAIELETRGIEHLLAHVSRNSLINLTVDGGDEATVLIKRVDRKPTTDELYHVDFYRVSMTHTLRVVVPLVLVGEAPAVETYEATVLRAMDALSIECLPGDLPSEIEVSLNGLVELHDAVHVRDLPIPRGVTVLADPDELVVHVVPPRVVEEAAERAEEAAAAEAEPVAEAQVQGQAEATGAAGDEPSAEKTE